MGMACVENTLFMERRKLGGAPKAATVVFRERVFFVKRCIEQDDMDGLQLSLNRLGSRLNLCTIAEECALSMRLVAKLKITVIRLRLRHRRSQSGSSLQQNFRDSAELRVPHTYRSKKYLNDQYPK